MTSSGEGWAARDGGLASRARGEVRQGVVGLVGVRGKGAAVVVDGVGDPVGLL